MVGMKNILYAFDAAMSVPSLPVNEGHKEPTSNLRPLQELVLSQRRPL